MTDTPLDLDAIEARARAAANAPWGNAREHVCRNDVPALVAALRKAEAQVAAALIADLRALRPVQHVCSDGVWLRYADVRDLADRHAPTTGATP